MTQHFANLNMMSEEEQIRSYKLLRVNVLQDVPLIIKKHPDDFLNYRKIFPDAECIKEIFPAELLPYVFWHKPTSIYTFDFHQLRKSREPFFDSENREEILC